MPYPTNPRATRISISRPPNRKKPAGVTGGLRCLITPAFWKGRRRSLLGVGFFANVLSLSPENIGDRRDHCGLNCVFGGAVMTLFVLIGWVFLSFVIAGAAYERGRNAFGWFLFSICFSPLIAGLFLLLFPPISSDQALQGSIREGQIAELPRKRGVGSWIVLIAVFGTGMALTAFGIANLHERQQTMAEAVPANAHGASLPEQSNTNAGQPTYLLDRSQKNVIALSNLASESELCQPGRLSGTIVKQQFDDKLGTVVTGVSVKGADGQRSFANVDVKLDNTDMVTKGWVFQGLQVLLKEGNQVSLGVKSCGAAGRVVLIDSISHR